MEDEYSSIRGRIDDIQVLESSMLSPASIFAQKYENIFWIES